MSAGDAIDYALERFAPILTRGVNLSHLSWWRIGGRARAMLEPRSVQELQALRSWFAEQGQPHVVIGHTSNLLFSDAGLDVPCIRISSKLGGLSITNTRVTAEAGIWVPYFARRLQLAGLKGLAHICGIPGTLGGLICMNGGSQRKSIGTHVVRVVSIDDKGNLKRRNQAACQFAYRSSAFQHNNEIVAAVTLQLNRVEDPAALRREMIEILSSRRRKFPKELPNCGSVFVSNPAMYAQFGPPGAVIERLGFKGQQVGGAQVSPVHANFIVNRGHARAKDVLSLILAIAARARQELGLSLVSEARYVSPSGRIASITELDPAALDEVDRP